MYRLYTDKGTRTLLDEENTEEEILIDAEKHFIKDTDTWLMIVYYNEITTEPNWFSIRGKDEFIEYMKRYYARKIQEKTCMELKKEMMDIVYGESKVKERLPKK